LGMVGSGNIVGGRVGGKDRDNFDSENFVF
jgi:hypothetical protein